MTSKQAEWVWQRGPWLMVDRVTGKVTALKLPDYDPGVSQVSWFRDYGAYCGLTATGKSLYAVVAQISARRPVLAKKISTFDAASQTSPACGPPDWQREPLRITFNPAGRTAVSYDIVPGSAVLVEDYERRRGYSGRGIGREGAIAGQRVSESASQHAGPAVLRAGLINSFVTRARLQPGRKGPQNSRASATEERSV